MKVAAVKRSKPFFFLLLFFCSLPVFSQDEPDYSSKVRLVEFVLQAVDQQGRHVKDLDQAEISIRAGGIERKAAFLSSENFEQSITGFDEPRVCEESSFGYSKTPRYILFLLHKVESRLGTISKTKSALGEFLQSSFAVDEFYSVVSFDKQVNTRLDFTNDRKQVLASISGLKLKHSQVKDGDDFYKYLSALAEDNKLRRGRMVIILLTEGMKGVAFSDVEGDFREAVRKLQAANIRVYAVDTGGISMRDPGASIAAIDPRYASKVRQSFNNGLITGPTGGTSFRRGNSILKLLNKVHYQISFHYVCGFYLKDGEELNKPLKLEVRTARSGITLRHKDQVQTLLKTK